MKRRFAFTIAVWWVIACTVAGAFLLVLSNKESRVSDVENRMLAGMPELTPKNLASGDFMDGFESFLSDNFFARQEVISSTESLLDRFSLLTEAERLELEAQDMERALDAEAALRANAAPENGELADEAQDDSGEALLDDALPDAAGAADVFPEDTGEAETSEPDEPEDVPGDRDALQEEDDDAETEREVTGTAGQILVNRDHSYIWYEKPNGSKLINYTYDNKDIQTYSNTLRAIQSYLPEDGVICFTQVPLAAMGNRWTDQQKTYCGWGSSVEMVLEKCLEGTERIYVFNTPEILSPYMTGSVPMFYHTDHHWTPEAAWIVLSKMLERQGLPVIPYDEYSYKAVRGRKNKKGLVDIFNALYPLLPVNSYVVTKAKYQKKINLMAYNYPGYLVFMNNSRRPWRRIVTGANTGRKALVICDSFGNAFTPYLLPYYSEVHMTDFRYGLYDKHEAGGSISKLMQHYGIDDVYIITSTANGLRKQNSLKFLRKYLED